MGAFVVLACRSKERADDCISSIKTDIPNAKLEFMQLDLADLNSVRSFADEYTNSGKDLHILINNAGIVFSTHWKSID